MNPINILELMGTSGVSDLLKSFVGQANNVDKLKLKFMGILIENMGDDGTVAVKDVLKELLDEKKFFDFIGED